MTNMHVLAEMHSVDVSILSLIGNTPLIRLTGIDTGRCELFLKLEHKNPGGSIKDRVGLAMIQAAERKGLVPGMTLVEGTSGNTGIGLALVGKLKGYKVKLIMPDRVSPTKIGICRALGAEVLLSPSAAQYGDSQHFLTVARRIGGLPGHFWTDQFSNPANVEAHYRGTGPELRRQLGQVDAVVCGVGSGGTLAGLSKYYAESDPDTQFVLADPVGSIIDSFRCREPNPQASRYLIEGVGSDFIPQIMDLSRVSVAYRINDDESLRTCREIAEATGILMGTSGGLLVAAALRFCRAQRRRMRVVTFVPDGGERYLAKIYPDSLLNSSQLHPTDSGCSAYNMPIAS